MLHFDSFTSGQFLVDMLQNLVLGHIQFTEVFNSFQSNDITHPL